ERNRLCRRAKPGHRIQVGGGQLRSSARIGWRSRPPQGRCDRGDRRRALDGAGGEKRDLDNSDRLFDGRRPGAYGLVAGLARPDANITGFSILARELMPKRLELLSELVPQARVIALLVNPSSASAERNIGDMQQAASVKGVQLQILEASTEG